MDELSPIARLNAQRLLLKAAQAQRPPSPLKRIALRVAFVLVLGLVPTCVSIGIFPVGQRVAAPLVCPADTVTTEVVARWKGSARGGASLHSDMYCISATGHGTLPSAPKMVLSLLVMWGLVVTGLVLLRRALKALRSRTAAATSVLLLVTLAGCRVGTLSPEEFDREYPLGRLITLGQPGRDASLAALREAVGGPVRITNVNFSEHRTQIIAQNPRAPENFDSYVYWKGDVSTSAISTRGDDEARMTQNLFDLDTVPFEKLPELARVAIETLAIDGAAVQSVSVTKSDGSLVVDVSLQSPRRSGRVRFDARGTVLSANRD